VTGLKISDRPKAHRQDVRWFLLPAITASFTVLLFFWESLLVRAGAWLVVCDPLEKADLIYVLAGDFFGNRVLLGAELGAGGYAKQVLFSGGAYRDQYTGDMAAAFAVEHGYPRELFHSVRLSARSTIDEARQMGPIFARLGAKRIILVTSSFHSRRAALVFRGLLPQFQFRIEGAQGPDFNPDLWWKSKHDRHLLWSEYRKIVGSLLIEPARIRL